MSESESSLPALRASDAERERAADVLRAAMASGRLGIDELDDRMRRVLGAQTLGGAGVTLPPHLNVRITDTAILGGNNIDIVDENSGTPAVLSSISSSHHFSAGPR